MITRFKQGKNVANSWYFQAYNNHMHCQVCHKVISYIHMEYV